MSVGGVFGPFVAFLAGLLSFVSPCVLPMVPVYLAQMAGSSAAAGRTPGARRYVFLHSLSFVAGFSLVFIALGASVGLAGGALRDHQLFLARVAAVLIIIMGLHLTGIVRIPALYRTYAVPVPAGGPSMQLAGGGAGGGAIAPPLPRALDFGRSSVVGAGFALGWTPCIGPVLGSILGLATAESTVGRGALLLFCYSLGLGVPFLVTGLAAGTATAQLKRINRYLPAIEVASGVLLIFVGVLLFANRLTMFNQYFDFFGLGTKGL